MRRHGEAERLELASRPARPETGVDAVTAVEECEVREAAKEREGVLETDVCHESRNPELCRVRRDRRQHREALGRHPCGRVVCGWPREEEVVALDDAGHAERLQTSRRSGSVGAVVGPRPGPRERHPRLDHRTHAQMPIELSFVTNAVLPELELYF
jgi:hypothetical protein